MSERNVTPLSLISNDCRFLLRRYVEGKGLIFDISTGGLALITDSPALKGDAIAVNPDRVGELNGRVVCVYNGGLGIEFLPNERQKETRSGLIAPSTAGAPCLRLYQSQSSFPMSFIIETNAWIEGAESSFSCTIIDLARIGCLMQSDVKPEIGERLVVGKLRGVVRHHTDLGFAIEFLKLSRSLTDTHMQGRSAA